MKSKKNLFSISTALVMLTGLFSCSTEEPVTPDNSNGIRLVKAPEVEAYSGSSRLGGVSTRSADGEPVVTSTRIKGEFDHESYLTQRKAVDEYLSEGEDNYSKLDMDFLFHAKEDLTFNFYYFSGWTANRPSYLGVFYFDENGEVQKVRVWDYMNPNDTDVVQVWDEDLNDYVDIQRLDGVQISVKAGYKFGFFWEGRSSSAQRCEYYSLSELNEPQQVNGVDIPSEHAGTFVIDGKSYIGFEDWTDFDFQDWIFFTDLALGTSPSDDKLPDFVQPDDEIDDTVKKGTNEIEVNLSLEDKDYLSSHLSIHVRHSTDVEIFIPVPVQYYCEADDMAIVEDKKSELLVHGGPYRTEYNVNGHTVSLNIDYQSEGIRIWTDGIDEEVIEYCRNNYGDGITFEVWNYFNESISREDLLYLLNKATIRFLDSEPDIYINAFTEKDGHKNPDDCHVTIEEDQVNDFRDGVEGEHNNGSSHNIHYEKKTD